MKNTRDTCVNIQILSHSYTSYIFSDEEHFILVLWKKTNQLQRQPHHTHDPQHDTQRY